MSMKIHFIGIGGIGVSALAQYYLANGHKVSGSDLTYSEITALLKKKGVKIFIGPHKSSNLKSRPIKGKNQSGLPDMVVCSPAVQEDNPELKAAKKLKIKCQTYPQALGELTKKYFTIAITGTHGKSTTTAMTALILIKAGLDPTVIVGTKLKEFGNSNFRMGGILSSKLQVPTRQNKLGAKQASSKILVIEACEHEESFLNYWPKILVLTNIEREHLDYYKNLKNILKAFKKFIGHLPKNGTLIVNKDGNNISKIKNQKSKLQIKNQKLRIKEYSLKQKIDVHELNKILKVPGEHNIYNALSALTVARALKIPDKISFKALSEYKGCWRRFEISKLKIPCLPSPANRHASPASRQISVVSDYAHHPTEIKTTLKATREKFPKAKIWCVFQPHQHQRTFYLFDDFVKVFKESLSKDWINKLIITEIYDVAGRENKIIKKDISSKKMVEEIRKKTKKDAKYISALNKTANYLKKKLKGGEVIIVMGAGDIYEITGLLAASS